ncbi:OmpH family outer membrane protein [Bacteroidales bacterium OttesenSCG-928-I21]|nr:OmpH family outer membrane protein [Bacteroidales bacterium OttesenSCG-928-I21]
MNNSKTTVVSLILSIIAISATIVISIVSFSKKTVTEVYVDENGKEVLVNGENISDFMQQNSDVAFIDTEKLLMEYKYSIKLNEDLLTEQSKARSSFESKYRQFEKKYNNFMEKMRLGSFLSQSSMESQQNELVQEQAKLEEIEVELSQKLMEKQAELNAELFDTLTTFLEDYNKTNNYSFILNKAAILHGKDQMDITDDVILKLNERYEQTQNND